MKRKNKYIFLVSCSSLIGQIIVDYIRKYRPEFKIIGISSYVEHSILAKIDKLFIVPKLSENKKLIIKKIIQITKKYNPILTVPCRDDDVNLLAYIKKDNVNISSSFVCGTHKISSVIRDKYKSYNFAKKNGLPFAKTILAKSKICNLDFAKRQNAILIKKPRLGYASKNVYFIKKNNLEKLENYKGFVIQEYIGNNKNILNFQKKIKKNLPLHYSLEKEKISIQLYISKSKNLFKTCITKHQMKQGISNIIKISNLKEAKKIANMCAKVFIKHGWSGPMNIQCAKCLDGRLKIFEFNGRFTGATYHRFYFGFDEIMFALKDIGNIKNLKDYKFNNLKISRELCFNYTDHNFFSNLKKKYSIK